MRSTGAAPPKSGEAHPPPTPQPEAADSDVRIFGAGRKMAAGTPDKARQRISVEEDQPTRAERRQSHHASEREPSGRPARRPITLVNAPLGDLVHGGDMTAARCQ